MGKCLLDQDDQKLEQQLREDSTEDRTAQLKEPPTQGLEKMCLSLEHQNLLKTSEKMGYFDRITVLLHIL